MEPQGKKVKRSSLIPKVCCRCGNDLLTGITLIHLPFEKRYIAFCTVCHIGLQLPSHLHQCKISTSEEQKKFWDEEVYGR